MSDYLIRVFSFENGKEIDVFPVKIKHFRQYTGRVPSTHGGHTAVFFMTDGLVYSSKCRNDEQFSRQKGVLTCLQKFFLSSNWFPENKFITSWNPGANQMTVYLAERSGVNGSDNGWLTK